MPPRPPNASRRSHYPWLMLACVLCGACSLALDIEREQCRSDADCAARGLVGGTCVAKLCQPPVGARSGNGSTRSPVEGVAGRAGDAGGKRDPSRAGGAGGASGAGTAGNRMSLGIAGITAAGAGGTPGGTTGTNSAGTSASGGSRPATGGGGGATSCPAGRCPECTTHEDCLRRGVASGMCVESRCWAPASQCETDADCVERGPEYSGGRCLDTQCRPNPKWRCEPVVPSAATGMITLTVPIVDALTLATIPNIEIVACNKLDVMCTQPVATATTGSDGELKINVPANFAGYLQQTEHREYAPAMYFLPAALPADGMLDKFPLLASGIILNALAVRFGAGLDPTRGHMMLIANDCFGAPQAGITFASAMADMNTVQFYVRDQLPSPTAQDTAAEGIGGYLNVPAGTAFITSREVKTGLELSTVSLLVRPGFISVSYARPMTR